MILLPVCCLQSSISSACRNPAPITWGPSVLMSVGCRTKVVCSQDISENSKSTNSLELWFLDYRHLSLSMTQTLKGWSSQSPPVSCTMVCSHSSTELLLAFLRPTGVIVFLYWKIFWPDSLCIYLQYLQEMRNVNLWTGSHPQ